jgi:hypothetical protein
MTLRPGLLWLTQNLILVSQYLSRDNIFLEFTCPVRYSRVPLGVRLLQVENTGLENVGSSTSHSLIELHGLLQG